MKKKNILQEEQLVSFSRRAFTLGLMQIGLITLLVGRLFQLQVKDHKSYTVLSDQNRFDIDLIAPSRGSILDRKGRILSANTASFDIEIVPEWSGDIRESLYKLSKFISISEDDIKTILSISKSQKSFLPISVKRNLDRQTISRVAVNSPLLSGVNIKQNERRVFPQGSITVHVTGYVGRVSKSELNKSFPELSLPGFRIGKTGIELEYDLKMRGFPGKRRVEVNSIGKIIRSSIEKQTTPGKNIQLSLDIGLQTRSLRRLQAGNDKLININLPKIKKLIKDDSILAKQLIEDRNVVNENLSGDLVLPESGSVVVIDVDTGQVLVSVSSPGFDPNKFDPGISASDWELLATHPRSPLVNKTISGQYPPGSTFKMMVGLAALEAGIISSKTKHFCSGHIEVGDMKFHCWNKTGHGSVNILDAIAQSCDVFFYEIALKTGINRIAEVSRKFGLGSPTGINLPGERSGLIPDIAWKRKSKGQTWRPGETIIAGIGQGYVLSTPMQLALMTARIANGGKIIKPSLLYSEKQKNTGIEKIDVSVKNLNIIKKSMEQVTLNERGTGRNFRLGNKGIEMAGKTGTVQVRRISTEERESVEGIIKNEDRPWNWRDHALYVGYAPMKKPRYAISVLVEHGGSGSSKAGPIARDIMEATLREDPTRYIPNNPFSRPKSLKKI